MEGHLNKCIIDHLSDVSWTFTIDEIQYLGVKGFLRLDIAVAPHAGAWIETGRLPAPAPARLVAPHAGAWIETAMVCGRLCVL